MESDLEATAHSPEQQLVSKNERLIAMRLRKRGEGNCRSIKQLFLDNQWGMSPPFPINSSIGLRNFHANMTTGICFNLVLLLYLTQLMIPKARPFTRPFLWLSHYNPSTGKYAVGSNDIYYVTYYLVLLTGLRDGLMNGVLGPLGRRWGISSAKDVERFAEQTWMICYYCIFWPLGVVCPFLSFSLSLCFFDFFSLSKRSIANLAPTVHLVLVSLLSQHG